MTGTGLRVSNIGDISEVNYTLGPYDEWGEQHEINACHFDISSYRGRMLDHTHLDYANHDADRKSVV